MTDKKRVGFFSTCIADLMRPQLARSALDLIKGCGHEPLVPRSQTCCGQPSLNVGKRGITMKLARKLAGEFSHCDVVVAPSGSCIGAIKTHIPKLFSIEEPGREMVMEFAEKCTELSMFLIQEKYKPANGKPLRIAYHDSCAGLRELGIHDGPRRTAEICRP